MTDGWTEWLTDLQTRQKGGSVMVKMLNFQATGS